MKLLEMHKNSIKGVHIQSLVTEIYKEQHKDKLRDRMPL
jgi:hypothetical protein